MKLPARTLSLLPWIVCAIGAGLALLRAPSPPEPRFAPPVTAKPPAVRDSFVNLLPAVGESAHSVSLADLGDGRIAAAWFAGSHEGAADVSIVLSTLDGQRWSPPTVLADRAGVQRDTGRRVRKLGNPVLWHDARGTLHCIFVSVGLGGWAGSSLNHVASTDGGAHWGRIERLVTSPFLNLSTLAHAPPLPLADGGSALPVYHEFIAKRPEWLRLDASGHVVDKTRFPGRLRLLQPAAAALDDTHAIALMRDASGANRIHAATTEDGGAHWSAPAVTKLPNPGAGIALLRLADGRLLLAYNPVAGNRNQLALAASRDQGRHWSPPMMLEQDNNPDAEFSYPALLQDSRGIIHLAYTWQRKRIKTLHFTPAWLETEAP